MATPCTNLLSLQLHRTRSIPLPTPPGFVPGSAPIPAFRRSAGHRDPPPHSVPPSRSSLARNRWNGRFLGTGGQGVITCRSSPAASRPALRRPTAISARYKDATLFCGSSNQGNALAAAFGDPLLPSTGLFRHPSGSDFGYQAITARPCAASADAFYGQHL